MRQICYVCGFLYGVKEPIEDDRETHGICPECLPWELQRIEKELGERVKVETKDNV